MAMCGTWLNLMRLVQPLNVARVVLGVGCQRREDVGIVEVPDYCQVGEAPLGARVATLRAVAVEGEEDVPLGDAVLVEELRELIVVGEAAEADSQAYMVVRGCVVDGVSHGRGLPVEGMDRVGDPHGPRHGTGVGPGVGLAGLLGGPRARLGEGALHT